MNNAESSPTPTPEAIIADLLSVLDLESLGTVKLSADGVAPGQTAGLTIGQEEADLFEGKTQPQPHGRIFGGQVLAQCVIAGGRTVGQVREGKERRIHSLHGYFLRPGDSTKPVRFAVERMRDGGSFSARRVHAIQNGAPIMSMLMSFQEDQDSGQIEHQVEMPPAADPETLPTTAQRIEHLDHPFVHHWAHERALDLRHDSEPLYTAPAPKETSQRIWLKAWTKLPDDPLLHAAIMAYASDFTVLEPAMRATGVSWSSPDYRAASLDHAMWFHRPVRMDEWVLFAQESPSSGGGRGLGTGRMFSQDGTLVATVAQEGMMRLRA